MRKEAAMSRIAIAAALSAALLAHAGIEAAAAPAGLKSSVNDLAKRPSPKRLLPSIKLPCGANYAGRDVTVTNNSGTDLRPGSKVTIIYYVAGKYDKTEAFFLRDVWPAGKSELMSYSGGPVSSCIVLVKRPTYR
jgi:hypothetical protein